MSVDKEACFSWIVVHRRSVTAIAAVPGLAMFGDLERVAEIFDDAGLIDVQWFGNTEVTETVELDGEAARPHG